MVRDTISRFRDIILKLAILSASMILLYPIYKLVLSSIIFSYAVYPSKRYICSVVKSNNLATLLTSVLWISVLIYFIVFLINLGLGAVTDLYSVSQSPEVSALFSNAQSFLENNAVGSTLIAQIDIRAFLSVVGNYLSRLLVSIPGVILQVFAIIIFSFYFLRDGGDFIELGIKQMGKSNEGSLREALKKLDNVFRSIIYGYLLSAVVIGLLVLAVLLILNVPQAFVLALVATIFSVIPLFGPAIPSIVAIIYFFYTGAYVKAGFMIIVWFGLTFVDDLVRMFVSRRGIKKEYKLHPLLFIFGIIAGPSLFGPIGIVVGPMIFGALTVLLDVTNGSK